MLSLKTKVITFCIAFCQKKQTKPKLCFSTQVGHSAVHHKTFKLRTGLQAALRTIFTAEISNTRDPGTLMMAIIISRLSKTPASWRWNNFSKHDNFSSCLKVYLELQKNKGCKIQTELLVSLSSRSGYFHALTTTYQQSHKADLHKQQQPTLTLIWGITGCVHLQTVSDRFSLIIQVS